MGLYHMIVASYPGSHWYTLHAHALIMSKYGMSRVLLSGERLKGWLLQDPEGIVLLGSTVVSPYVGMARKQNGGHNASISVQTLIFHLVVNSTRLKTVRSARWCCPNYTMAPRLVENVVKVTNLEVVKIVFRHLPFLILLLLLLQPA